MNLMWPKYKWIVLIVFLVAVSYLPMIDSFFQQDEWLAFGRHIVVEREGWGSVLYNTFFVPGGHFNPLNFISIHILFELFHLNFVPYALMSLFLHLLVVVEVYFLVKLITDNDFLSSLSALFFGIFASHFQASTWVVADISTHGATIFALLSIVFFYKYLLSKAGKIYYLSILFLIISILFKELAIGLFILYLLILYFDRNNHPDRLLKITILLSVLMLYFLSRFFLMSGTGFYGEEMSLSKKPSRIVYNVLTLPYKSIVQGILPSDELVKFSYKVANFIPIEIAGVKETPEYNIFVEKKILEVVNLIFFLIMFFLVIKLVSKVDLHIRIYLMLYLLFVISSSFLFAFAPEKDGIINIVDSRNLYFINTLTVIVFSIFIWKLFRRNPLVLVLLVIAIVVLNIFWLEQKLLGLRSDSKLKRDILDNIKRTVPNLSDKNIFYTESDRTFYGLPENQKILPFQSGLGQTLLVWYSKDKSIPSNFFRDKFLWDITSEGYKEQDGFGFGYFRSFNNMAEVVKKENIDVKSINAFRFDSDILVLKDISEQIKGGILSYLEVKKEVVLSSKKILPSENIDLALLMIDSNIKTDWHSQQFYNDKQKILIELDNLSKINHVSIDSNSSKDQNQTGIRILVSKDNKIWEEVYFSKTLNWDQNGVANVYFSPVEAKFITLEQTGNHKYAQWVINEIKFFEVYAD